MYWIDSIIREKISPDNVEIASVEFKTEVLIAGLGSMRNSNFLIGPTIESRIFDTSNLKAYEARLSYPIDIEKAEKEEKRTKKSYYHTLGIAGEIRDLFSIFFHTRVYVTSRSIGQLTENSIRSREVSKVIRGSIPSWYTKYVIKGNSNSFVDFIEFLKSLEKLPTLRHQKFINACTNYNLALQQIGISDEMAFVRLVSAIESLSNNTPLSPSETKLNTETFQQAIKGIEDKDQILELEEIFLARKSTLKFKKFIKKYSSQYLKERTDVPYGKITEINIDSILSRIYQARSRYLHTGDSMFISTHMGDTRLDMDPTTGMSIGLKWFNENEKLPTLEFFEGLVRHCILSNLNESLATSS